jgi:dienelactone hydrolase
MRRVCRFTAVALSLVLVPGSILVAQAAMPRLVVPAPAASAVREVTDSFQPAGGQRRPFHVYLPQGARPGLPVVVFANATNADFATWPPYQDWARLVTTRGFAGVLYPGPGFDPGRTGAENATTSMADLDSVVATLRRRGGSLKLDLDRLVIWAGSGQTWTGTPFALEGKRPGISGYVLYYGGGEVTNPRVDVPVLVVRGGLDSPALNRGLDSLALALVRAGVPLTLISLPSSPHAFDIIDSSATVREAITTTLDFMTRAVDRSYREAVLAGAPSATAAALFSSGRWAEAEERYEALARAHPNDRIVMWRLGLAQLEAGHPDRALASLEKARELGQGGARDIGLPATRAAVRVGDTTRAVSWANWSLKSFPNIRKEIQADPELASLLDNPSVGAPSQ